LVLVEDGSELDSHTAIRRFVRFVRKDRFVRHVSLQQEEVRPSRKEEYLEGQYIKSSHPQINTSSHPQIPTSSNQHINTSSHPHILKSTNPTFPATNHFFNKKD
jgi:hypothetical protein